MKNTQRIKLITVLTLIIMIFLLCMWLVDVYFAHQAEYKHIANKYLQSAIDSELSMRKHSSGIPFFFNNNPSNEDSSSTITQQIQLEDSSIIAIAFDKYDLRAQTQAEQYLMSHINPINIDLVNNIFCELFKVPFSVNATYIEYVDLTKHQVIKSNQNTYSSFGFFASDVLVIDMMNTLGVRAHVCTPFFAILSRMLFQLILSVILIGCAAGWLYKLICTIALQHKLDIEKQGSVNAMTHELKRPISSAIFLLERADDEPAKSKKFIKESIHELKKLNLYTEKIQEISIGESHMMKLEKEYIDLKSFFDQLQSRYIENEKVNLTVQMDQSNSFFTDKMNFSNIIDNLVENAIKYSDEPADIRIEVESTFQKLVIHIIDHGWGIPAKELPFIFDKFYRGKSMAKRVKDGFGLGLSYVHMMTKALGGEISVDSEEGKYTEFILEFQYEYTSDNSNERTYFLKLSNQRTRYKSKKSLLIKFKNYCSGHFMFC